MNIKEIEEQIGTIHTDELRSYAKYTYASNGRLGYGDSALDACLDAGCEPESNGVWQHCDASFPFVSQCWDKDGGEFGLLFKW
jgi:hypothetical protein